MNPILARGLILAAEVLVFLVITVAGASFISHAVAWQSGEADPPPAEFPLVVFEGDRARPEPKNYSVMALSEWETLAGRRPDASLLLPERTRNVELADQARATFSVTEGGDTQQTVELRWSKGDREQIAIYAAQAREIKPRYLRKTGTNTFLMAALLGFFAGLLAGKVLRRKFL